MNKRQAKKKYKKAHGHNPPSRRQLQATDASIYEDYNAIPEQVTAAVKKMLRIYVSAFADAAEVAATALRDMATSLSESEEKEQ